MESYKDGGHSVWVPAAAPSDSVLVESDTRQSFLITDILSLDAAIS